MIIIITTTAAATMLTELLLCTRQYANHFRALTHVILLMVYRYTHIPLLLIFLPCDFVGLGRNSPW